MCQSKYINKEQVFPFNFFNRCLSAIARLIIFFLFCSIIINHFQLPSIAQAYDPKITWSVLETHYSKIIYPSNLTERNQFRYLEVALHIAEIVDDICPKISLQFKNNNYPHNKFAIILEDFSDSVYGFATIIPHPLIRINLAAPGFHIFDTKFDSWLRILVTHEYTHLAHFDMTGNLTSFLRLFLGQIIAPSALQPLWSIEGLAIYNESKFCTGGRVNDSRYEMYLRADFLENNLKTLDQIEADYLLSWPGGNAPYIYGQSLVHFIAQEYGEEKLISLSKKFSSFPLMGFNWSLKTVLGIDLKELIYKWKTYNERHFNQNAEDITQENEITHSQQITNHRYWVQYPSWLIDKTNKSAFIIYKVFSPWGYPTIRKYNLATKKESILLKRSSGFGTSYSVSPDANFLLYSKLIQYQQYYAYNDLFLYDLSNNNQYKITEKMRIKDPSWHPDSTSNKIVAVINEAGTDNLVLFSLQRDNYNNSLQKNMLINFSDLIFLTDFQEGTQISQPVWSPKGDMIALSLYHKGFQDIYLVFLSKDNRLLSVKPLTVDRYTDINPNWSNDGKYLFFSSDRNGFFNLYAYCLSDEKYFRLTNVVSGAFEPAFSPDGDKMAFVKYHSSGYELHLAELDDLLWQLIDKPILDFPEDLPTIKNNIILFPSEKQNENKKDVYTFLSKNIHSYNPNYSIKNYTSWSSFLPSYWIPYMNLSEKDLYLGISVNAHDYLGYFRMPVTLAQGIFHNSFLYNIQFSDYKTYPIFSFSWQGEKFNYTKFQLGLNFFGSGYTSQQDYGRPYNHNFTIKFQNKHFLTKNENDKEIINNYKKANNSLILSYHYQDTEKYQGSTGSETGNSFSLNYQYTLAAAKNSVPSQKIVFDGRKYIPLSFNSNNQVLALRMVAGCSAGEPNEDLEFKLGGSSSNQNFASIDTGQFSLRGFPASSFTGNQILLGSLEYRFPIKIIEKKVGPRWASFFLEQISGKLFLDAGNTWDKLSSFSINDLNASIGAEVDFQLKQKYSDKLTLSFGIGKAITGSQPSRFFARVGYSF